MMDVSALTGPTRVTGLQVTRLAAQAPKIEPAAAELDFASVLASVDSSAVHKIKAGEAAAISALQGEASVQEVVQAVMVAEQTLQTAIAVRDKVVAAYQELSRMAI